MKAETSRQKSKPLKHYYKEAVIQECGELCADRVVSVIKSLNTITSVETIRKRVPVIVTQQGYQRLNTTKVVMTVWSNVMKNEKPHEKYIKVFLRDMQLIGAHHHYSILQMLDNDWLYALKDWHPYQNLIQVILGKANSSLVQMPELYVSHLKEIVPLYKCLKFFNLSYGRDYDVDVHIKGRYQDYLLGIDTMNKASWRPSTFMDYLEMMLWFHIAHELKNEKVMHTIVDVWLQNISVAHRGQDYVLSPFDAFLKMSDIDVKDIDAWYKKYDFFALIQHLPLSAQRLFTETSAREELYHVLNSLEMTSVNINHYFADHPFKGEAFLHF